MSAKGSGGHLAEVLQGTGWILLDFDGPVCSVFAGYPAKTIAAELRDWITHEGVHLPRISDDPHDVLRQSAELSGNLRRQVEARLCSAEIRAVATAAPTPGADTFLAACQATQRPVAIVSNNAAGAIRSYLDRMGLARLISHVEGRNRRNSALMKPHPHSLIAATKVLRATVASTVFIGDSTSDMQAGAAAGVLSVGYANKPGKRDWLADAGAAVVVEDMASLAAALTDPR